MPISLALVVEDRPSEVVVRRLLMATGREFLLDNVQRWSKDTIRARIHGINRAARGFPWLVLTDQDTAKRCPPVAIRELREPKHPNLLYRFAAMEIESWILADRRGAASFLRVPCHRIPQDTDSIAQPKEFLLGLARRSRSRAIREDLVPRRGSTSRVGPDYNGRLSEFVAEGWDPGAACDHSPSLKRSFARIASFAPIIS